MAKKAKKIRKNKARKRQSAAGMIGPEFAQADSQKKRDKARAKKGERKAKQATSSRLAQKKKKNGPLRISCELSLKRDVEIDKLSI